MDDRRIVFDADIDAYVDDQSHRPPVCKHSQSCLVGNDSFHARQRYYTLPLSCIRNHCKIDKWSLANDNSHLQLQCGASLQLVLNDMLTDGTITIHQYYKVLDCFRNAVYENIGYVKNLKFSQKRASTVKLNGRISNYKNEFNKWIFLLQDVHVSIGKLTLTSPSMKLSMTKHK